MDQDRRHKLLNLVETEAKPICCKMCSCRTCAGCNAEIGSGRFLSCMGGFWHPECFCCHACKLPITDYEVRVLCPLLYAS